ncbi:GAF and ANTAR domain-containing protein [Nocardioides aestuarii]|uniref:GAF and ANTAR domain-containing protein n=1 Tax=Nocardioides aestuarii TaxID=252231 RepID=UPI0031E34EEA
MREDVTPELLVCTALVRGDLVDGCTSSVLLGPDERYPMAHTDAHARRLDEVQFTLWEGPGPEAVDRGVPRWVADVRDSRQWPLLGDALAGSPVRGMVALPLLTPVGPVGLFTAYRRRPGRFAPSDVASLVAFADAVATLALGRIDADRDGPLPRPQVGVAVGRVMAHHQLDAEDALSMLRAYAFRTGRTVMQVAGDLTSGRSAPADLDDGRR